VAILESSLKTEEMDKELIKAGNSLQQSSKWKHLNDCAERVCSQVGVSKTKAQKVAAYYLDKLRDKGEDTARILILAELPLIAQDYGAMSYNLDIQHECVKLILDKFSHLAIGEIREAYREYASGESDVKGGEMYYGVFNAMNLGKVLTAYSENRRKVLAAILTEASDSKRMSEDERRKAKQKARFDKEFPITLMKAKEKIDHWRDVPEYFYHSAMKRGYIKFEKGEGQAILNDAKELVDMELTEWEETNTNRFRRKPDRESLAKSIARKITVFRKIILNDNFKI